MTISDLAMSNVGYTEDGDDSLGCKIIVESPGAPPQNEHVVKDDMLALPVVSWEQSSQLPS